MHPADDLASGENMVPFVGGGPYPVRAGNHVRPLIDGEPAFTRICELIDTATRSVWLTVTFLWPDFQMPGGRGSAFDVLDRAVARGIDVRVIFWRPNAETAHLRTNAFHGDASHRALLAARRSGISIRWDRAAPGFCQHQKTWLFDADTDRPIAIAGGINLNPHSVASPGHAGAGQNHDVYLELTGPAVADIHHNFVQRWNGASERLPADGHWGPRGEADLPFPVAVPAARGPVLVQVQRTMPPNLYSGSPAAPGAPSFAVSAGERTNFDQYCQAIAAATRAIYLENQYLDVPEIVAALEHALARGVEIVLVMPAEPSPAAPGTVEPARAAALAARATLGRFPRFTLAGLAGPGAGRREPVYVHSKLMLIDDTWATVGSCNLHRFSLFGNCELNIAFADPASTRELRAALFQEHLGFDTATLDDRTALRVFAAVARDNARRLAAGDRRWQGIAFALDPATYPG